MSDRDLKPDNMPPAEERSDRDRREDAALARGELRHDEGEDKRGRWGMR